MLTPKGAFLLKREFTVANEYVYNQASPVHWIISHLVRYTHLIISYILTCVATNILVAAVPALTGVAFTLVLQGDYHGLVVIALTMLGIVLFTGCCDFSARYFAELLGKRLARDAREELYVSLLGKSQTFHNRQRVGDIMARAANDMTQLSSMIVPGFDIVFDSFTSLAVTIVFIAIIDWQLLLVPLLFIATFLVTLRYYSRKLNPVSNRMREQFGELPSATKRRRTPR